jgi:hypothetical protein
VVALLDGVVGFLAVAVGAVVAPLDDDPNHVVDVVVVVGPGGSMMMMMR